jgi:hypothetical protein
MSFKGGRVTCYAVHLGDCAGSLSKEHYVSESLLEIAGTAVQVTGFPWQSGGEPAQIGTASLAAKILCKRHNEQLSPLDTVAKVFLSGLKASFQEASENRLSNSTYQTSGSSFELWLLKVLCGLLPLWKVAVPHTWVDILFQRSSWPLEAGLYIFGTPGMASWHFTLVRVISVMSTGDPSRIAGAKFGIGGLTLLLAFGTPKFTEPGMQALYRPASLLIERDGKQNRHVLSWDDHDAYGTMNLRITGEIASGAGPRPIVEPVG